MVAYLEWTHGLLAPRHYSSGLDPQETPEERMSLTGRLANGAVPGLGIWRPKLVEIPVHKSLNLEVYEGIVAQLHGRDVPVLLPFYHYGRYPKASDPSETTFSSGQTFEGGAGFFVSGTTALIAKKADAGTVFVCIKKVSCGKIRPGHAFSVGWHLYQVRFVEEQDGAIAKVQIRPELRADVYIRDEVEFVRPVVMVTVVDGAAFNVEMQFGRYAEPSLQFIENTKPHVPSEGE
ncbi:hypothetical protein [Pseudovibrio sp. POLY-S9]|uniref:hypothetical protein n=1 Tax=Pseudovibrio sp. POLY-S9 TaxID=1576596 RepID=UPI00070E0649|nr:hypothetical protein [Pseudovibrio sp. POLY-S9]